MRQQLLVKTKHRSDTKKTVVQGLRLALITNRGRRHNLSPQHLIMSTPQMKKITFPA